MYQSLYTLIESLVFDGTMNAIQTEAVTWLSTCLSLLVVALPVIAICRLILWGLGSWR